MTTPIAGQTYVTRDGDTLRTIAEQAYGDGAKWKLIYDANRERVQMADPETAVLSAGVRFELPAAPRERVTGSFAARERATGAHEKLAERDRLTGSHDALEPPAKPPERARPTGPHEALKRSK